MALLQMQATPLKYRNDLNHQPHQRSKEQKTTIEKLDDSERGTSDRNRWESIINDPTRKSELYMFSCIEK